MKHIRGLVTTAQALRQTFVAPRIQALPRPQFFRYPPVQSQSQLRSRYTKSQPQPQPDVGEIRDEDIQSNYIRIVDENNKLKPPESLKSALFSINRETHFILQVDSAPVGPPVCKIINRSEHFKRTRELAKAAKAARASNASAKQIELNWAIDAHDLSHRLGQMQKFLDKGRAVEIIMLRRKQRQTPSEEMVKSLMAKVLQAVKDAGAIQSSPMEGEPGKRVMLTVKKKDS